MCKAASFIVTKNKVLFSPWVDSHSQILTNHGISDYSRNPKFVRVEISPEDSDYLSPFDTWAYKRDQDFLPDWAHDEELEAACRAKLPEWAACHIIRDGKHTIDATNLGDVSIYIYGGEVEVIGQTGGECLATGNATLNATGQTGGECLATGNATLNATGQTGGYCRVFDNATLNATGQTGGDCWAYGNATLNATGQTGGDCWAIGNAKYRKRKSKKHKWEVMK